MALPAELLLRLHDFLIRQSPGKREGWKKAAHQNEEKEDEKLLSHPSLLLLLRILVQILPFQRMTLHHLFRLDLSREDRLVHREDTGPEMGIVEMDDEDKPYCQQGLVAMDRVGNVEKDAGQKSREEFRKPEHKARAPNKGNPPEDSPVVEFLPVGESTKPGRIASPQKVSDVLEEILKILFGRNHGIRSQKIPFHHEPVIENPEQGEEESSQR